MDSRRSPCRCHEGRWARLMSSALLACCGRFNRISFTRISRGGCAAHTDCWRRFSPGFRGSPPSSSSSGARAAAPAAVNSRGPRWSIVTSRYRGRWRLSSVDRSCGVRNVRVVHNGIDVERFDRPSDLALRSTFTGGTERRLVLTLARLHWQKGLRHLIAAAAEVPEAVFIVAGEGEERPRLEDDVTRLGLGHRFRFLGHRTDIPDLLAACDVVVLPSLFEGLPVSILEAMAARKPVVATAIEGNDEAVADGVTGLLVPPADPSSLARAIRRVLGDAQLANCLAAASRARVEQQFSARAMVVWRRARVPGTSGALGDTHGFSARDACPAQRQRHDAGSGDLYRRDTRLAVGDRRCRRCRRCRGRS